MVAGQTTFAAPYFSIVRDMLIVNHHGYAGGTGLKIFPDELVNLYNLVLGETHFVKVSMNAGFPLPDSRFPYATEDA